jgi:plasmid stability protein
MHTIQLRNLPKEIYDGVKVSAEISRRSMTQEVIHILAIYLDDQKNRIALKQRKEKAIEKIKMLNNTDPLTDLNQAMDWIKMDRK